MLNRRWTSYFLVFRFLAARFFEAFFGTLLPTALASERPIAIACLRLVTFLPDRPLFKVPALRFFITRSTSAEAFFEYFRAMMFSRLRENNLGGQSWFPFSGNQSGAVEHLSRWERSAHNAG
jgi:hypothetical protein